MRLRLLISVAVVSVAILCPLGQSGNRLARISSPDKLVSLCMLGRYHKPEPGPEPDLSGGPCAAYAGRACCSAAVGNRLDSDDEFANAAFRLNHCGKPLSQDCSRWFERSRCMYECSPYLGPWLVKVSGYGWRSERVYGLPLCRRQCQDWFNACRSDLTCVPNWSADFVWVRRDNSSAPAVNQCPMGPSSCRTFAEVFQSASQFCETVWDGEFDVVSETLPCHLLDWPHGQADPNAPLAAQGARERLAFLTSGAAAGAAAAGLMIPPFVLAAAAVMHRQWAV